MLNTVEMLSQKLNISSEQIKIVMDLLGEGATIPFLARYRKNITGGLDEEQLEGINKNYQYLQDLNKRKEAIIKILKEKDLLNSELEQEIIITESKSALEDIYLPFKEGKKTKASKAIELGLKPLAIEIMTSIDPNFNPMSEAKKYISDKVVSVEFAIEQTKLIISELMSQDIKARQITHNQLFEYGYFVTKKKRSSNDEKEKFKQYYDFKEKINRIPNHRVLASNRGESLKILSSDIEYNEKKLRYDLNDYFFKIKRTGNIILDSLDDAIKRLIIPAIKRQIFRELSDRASKDSISLFANNLETMLLSPAIKGKRILAIDPGFISGCKVAAITENGDVLDVSIIKPHPPIKQVKESIQIINDLINKHKLNLVVIGNGTASRETERLVFQTLKNRDDSIPFAIVSEVGASVYSASKIAIKEFPNLSVEQRSAIHIGRKFQDPLNELVKIDPKAIGIGQYQHDVNQKELQEALSFKVNKVVNIVGVDVNAATEEILSYISGLSTKVSNNIVLHRKRKRSFYK